MREGHGVCHILTQNLGDTTKVQLTNTSHANQVDRTLSHILIRLCVNFSTHRPLKSCCVPMILIITWVRALESSWHRTRPLHKEWSPRSVDVRSTFVFLLSDSQCDLMRLSFFSISSSSSNTHLSSFTPTGDSADSHDDKTDHELLALR